MDRQQQRVYAWEAQWADWNAGHLSLRGARSVVRWACKKYGLPPPVVKQHPGKAYSFSCGSLISFSKGQRNSAIALHESAHYIATHIFGNSIEHHAQEWLGIYLWLLEGYRVAPRIALHASAKAKGLRWTPTWVVSPKRLRGAAKRRKRGH